MLIRSFVEKGLLPGKPETHKMGNCLFKQGEPTDYFFLVTRGSVALVDEDKSIDQHAVAPPYFMLGITDLLNDNYSFTAYTLERTELFRIGKTDLQEALHHNPVLRLYLLKQMSCEATLTNTVFE
jgi:CRP-like cAMP-binding protein